MLTKTFAADPVVWLTGLLALVPVIKLPLFKTRVQYVPAESVVRNAVPVVVPVPSAFNMPPSAKTVPVAVKSPVTSTVSAIVTADV